MAEKMMTVNQVSRLCGISVRTLHYYDELGLLSPSSVTGAGYRMYGKDALSRLQQILFFRELDFSLKEIRQILDNPSFDPGEALSSQREILTLKRDRLNGLISLVDSILKGEKAMSFAEFDQSEIEAAQEKYAAEARERWGGTEAYRESQKKTSGYSKEDWNAVTAEQEEIFRRFAAVMDQPPESPEAQALAARWQEYITERFYPCTKEILAGLGQMYTADPRFTQSIDRFGDGLARFISAAIAVYCG